MTPGVLIEAVRIEADPLSGISCVIGSHSIPGQCWKMAGWMDETEAT